MTFYYDPFEPDPQYLLLREKLIDRLGPDRNKPLLISIDGWCGSGKSSLASWLAWQLAIQALYLDMFLIKGQKIRFSAALKPRISACISRGRPVIIEGAGVDIALEASGVTADYKIFVIEKSAAKPISPFKKYFATRRRKNSDFCLFWEAPNITTKGG